MKEKIKVQEDDITNEELIERIEKALKNKDNLPKITPKVDNDN